MENLVSNRKIENCLKEDISMLTVDFHMYGHELHTHSLTHSLQGLQGSYVIWHQSQISVLAPETFQSPVNQPALCLFLLAQPTPWAFSVISSLTLGPLHLHPRTHCLLRYLQTQGFMKMLTLLQEDHPWPCPIHNLYTLSPPESLLHLPFLPRPNTT